MSSNGVSNSGRRLETRDRQVLRAASPAFASSPSSSPRRRWSPRSSGSSPGRQRSRWSPSRWSPSRISPNRRKYEELGGGTDDDSLGDNDGVDIPNFKENDSPIAELSMDGIPVPDKDAKPQGQESPAFEPVNSPASRSYSLLRSIGRRPSEQPRPKASNPTNSPCKEQKQREIQSSPQISSPGKSESHQVFRFKLQTLEDGTEAVIPAPLQTTDVPSTKSEEFDTFLQQRRGSSKGSNLNTSENSSVMQPTLPQTVESHRADLHVLCRTMSTWDDLMRAKSFLLGHLEHASRTDSHGRTPLHLIASNKYLASAIGIPSEQDLDCPEELHLMEQPTTDLSEPNLERHLIRFIVGDLLAANPGALLLRDDKGYIPFESVLFEWVHSSKKIVGSRECPSDTTATTFSYSTAVNHVWNSTKKMVGRHPSFVSTRNATRGIPLEGDIECGTDNGSVSYSPQDGTTLNEDKKPEGKDKNVHRSVYLSPQARFVLTAVSAVLDQLELALNSKQGARPPPHSKQGNASVLKELRAYQENVGSVNIVSSVVQTIASIPNLMKTILLIDSDEDRAFVFATSVIRRVMLSKKSIGPWLTQTLQSRDRRLAQRTVNYLNIVSSELSAEKSVSPSTHVKKFDASDTNDEDMPADYHQFIDEVSRLQDFIPSLLALNDRGIENASTTLVVKKVLGRMISRPFAVTIILFDAIFLALLIIGFRTGVNHIIEGAPVDNTLHWIYLANVGIFYFIIREIGKIVSLFLISKQARTYFFSFWNVMDFAAIILALASTVSMRFQLTILEEGLDNASGLRGLWATTTGFLWLRVLSQLKAINMQLATFVLAILQIGKDIMFFTLMAPSTCAAGGGDDMQCKPAEYLLRVYTMLLGDFGDFEREEFTTVFVVFLAVFFSFLVTVILLNVLIAVASDSYEKCLIRSQYLFGRARVMLVAELVSFQNLLKTTNNESTNAAGQSLYSPLGFRGRFTSSWSRGSALFLFISVMVIATWTVSELLGFSKDESNTNLILSLGSVAVNVLLFSTMILFLSSASKQPELTKDNDREPDWFFQRAMLHLLGSTKNSDALRTNEELEWNGRVQYLQNEMKRISREQMAAAVQQTKAMELLVVQSEQRMRTEIESLEGHFISIRNTLLDEVKTTRRTNQNVSMAVEELRQLMSVASSTVQRSPVPAEVNIDNSRFHGLGN
eukprot:Nitzschia sp. Nitz4//scaffold58_size112336//91997//95608//NITZ4_004047-RA/size112336-processed-gene-0.225-mRNA-1//-1//CDS//3329555031//3828//frame0